jgi:hypothetical protein
MPEELRAQIELLHAIIQAMGLPLIIIDEVETDDVDPGGYVETIFKGRLYLPEINSRNASRRQYAERTAINAPMQGTAAGIIKRAMINIDHWNTQREDASPGFRRNEVTGPPRAQIPAAGYFR